ncbi:MAG TPA: peptidylprolyl isomerase [Pseudohongiella sp.]|nr:peptidylprolyl isomerase [Pseudohongiella sp.]
MKFWQTGIVRTVLLATAVSAAATPAFAANPLVRVSTTYGDFTVELFQDRTPATVQNFLGYMDRGEYRGAILHRLDKDFVIQTGYYRWNGDCATGVLPPACGPVQVPTQDPVPNEPGISNVEGTLAMAKIGDLPDSATSQWFVNLRDNSENLDQQNGGFTVFGQILGDGMEAVKRINSSINVFFPVSEYITQLPVRDMETAVGGYPAGKNLVLMNMWRVDRHSSSLHVFEFSTGILSTYVNAGDSGRLSLLLKVVPNTGAETIFEIDPASLVPLAIEPDGMATFSWDDLRLRLPVVEVNQNGQVQLIYNAVLRMTDQATLRFVLESYSTAP